jgi:hypothetical protein
VIEQFFAAVRMAESGPFCQFAALSVRGNVAERP